MPVEEIAAQTGADRRGVASAGEEVQPQVEVFGSFGFEPVGLEPLDGDGLDGAVVGAVGDDGPSVELVAVGVAAPAALEALDLAVGVGGGRRRTGAWRRTFVMIARTGPGRPPGSSAVHGGS